MGVRSKVKRFLWQKWKSEKIYTDTGMDTGVMGIIAEVRHYYSWSMEHWRKVRLHGKLNFIDDYTIRIVSKADINGRDRKNKNIS